MRSAHKSHLSSEKGFALVTAVMACVILFALAMLVIQLSTGDLRVSARTVGDKKAMNAAEAGLQWMTKHFDADNLGNSAVANAQVDSTNDPNSVYTIGTPGTPASGAIFLPLAGYSIGGAQSLGQRRYVVTITGRNTSYNTRVDIAAGVGYGPVETSTMSR